MAFSFRSLLPRTGRKLKRVARRLRKEARRTGRISVESLEDRTLLSSNNLTALDAYIAAPDPAYTYSLNSTLTGQGYTDYVINMISQTWRSPTEVNNTVWQHWLQIIVPTTVTSHTGVLEIDGGSNSSTPPTSPDSIGVLTATTLGAITTVLPTVPNEPLTFAGQTSSFTEDQIVAYSFERFLNGGDSNWPVLLPMVKSAVKAMDTTQSFITSQSGGSLQVDNFIVTGASKRGWTTWLTPAVDSRVVAIVPFVFDFLNQAEQVPNLKDTYVGVTQHIVGGFPDAVQDYTNDGVFASYGTPQGQALQQIVDPFTYIGRSTYDIPKYMVNSTGDQFFVPDSAQFYFSALPGQNYLRYVPNTDHGLDTDALTGALNFEKVLLDGVALPQFSWTVTNFGTAINLHTIDTPASVTMWQATNPNNRDFRLEDFGANWTSSPLTDQGGGNYVASVSVPATGATAFFIQMTYNVDGVTLTFTTQISTVPLFTPAVAVADPDGTYTGKPFAATATATGVSGYPVPGTFTYTYYAGSTVSGTGSSTAPTNPGTYTVVASFASSDPAYLNGQSAPLTFTISATSLNNGVLTIFGDGSSAIDITRYDSGALDVSVNSVLTHYDPGTVTSIVVDGAGGSDSLTVSDTTTASQQTYTLTATTIDRTNSQPITYSDVPTITLDAGNLGNVIDWQSTSYGVFYVYTGTGANILNFGDTNNTLNSFQGVPVVEGQGSNNTVNVDDAGNTTPRTYVLTADSLSPNGGQGFGYGVDIQTANYYFGSGGNVIDWQGVAAGETVTTYTGAGANTINFGDANNTLDSFLGTPVLVGQGTINTANIFDQGSTAAHTYVITPTSLTRDGGTGYFTGLTATNYNLGDGGNTIDWQGTAAGDTTTVYTGTGDNTINIGDGGNTLDEFQGTPDLVGQGSHNTANYYDQGGSAAFWSGFGGNAQHTAISPTAGQQLDGVSWQTKVDLAPQYDSSGELLIHYGEPAITQGNTLIIPVKVGATGGFELEAVDGNSGAVRWTIPTDYILPSYNWLPSFGPVMTSTGRVYFAGAGGTVYYFDNPDSVTAPVVHQLAFYGLANYQANAAAFNNSVFIDTPLTADANGDVFFGFRVQGTAPAPISSGQSGYARIGADGSGTYALVGAMSGDSNIVFDSHNAAPALSPDGKTLYVVTKYGYSWSYGGYLVALDSTTLQTKSKVYLADPRNDGYGAGILDDGSSSALVAPDGTVFIGVMGTPYNGSRGFMLHYSADLSTEYTPGAFGWDDTGSIVPASMVPGYTGTSSYLLFVKYNNYVAAETGNTGGDGVNEIAILDPNATQPDDRNDAVNPNGMNDPSLLVMKEVMTIAGPTPDTQFLAQYPDAVHEWCLNSTVIDPATDSIYANSEDGKLYRWDLATNTLSQTVVLTPGLGEAYTPTWVGPDGRVYAINNATLFSVGIAGWGGHNGAQFTAPTYSTAPTAAGTTAPHTYVLTGSSITRDGFTFSYSGLQALTLYGGSGGNTIDWQGTSATTTVYSGTGANIINFGDANNTLDGFQGTPILQGQGSNNTVNVHDDGSTAAHTYVITADSLTRDGGTGYGYGTGYVAVNYYFSSGGNTIDWQGTAAGVTTTVYTGAGANIINFGDANNTLDGFQGTPILQGQGSNNTVNVHDDGSTAAHTYVITATSLTRDGGTGYGYDLQNINFYFGSGGNIIDWEGNSLTQVENETVYTGAGANTINFGDANNTLNSFGNTITLYGQGSNNTVNVYDQGTTFARHYILGTTANDGSLFSLDDGAAYDTAYDIQTANIYLGSGGNILDWQGVNAGQTTTVYTGTGDNMINFGDTNNTLDGFKGTPILQGQGSNNTVNVHDDGSTVAHTYVITGTSLTRDGGTGYGYDVQTVNYYFGSGGNIVDWQGDASGEVDTVYSGTGVNTINFGDANNTLSGFDGTPILQGQGGNNTINIYDQGFTGARAYVVTPTSFSDNGGSGFGYGYDIQNANIFFGSGANTVDWQGNAAGTLYSVNFGTGSDQVSGSYNSNSTSLDGVVSLTGATAAFGTLTIGGSGTLNLAQAATGTITATSVNNQGTISGSGYLTLADSGDFTSGNLNLVLGGTTPGSTYDQVQVGGSATLTGSLGLSLVPGFVPTPGQTFTIVEDTASTPIGGTFTGLPAGTLIHVNGVDGSNQPFTTIFQISYAGSDVVLTNVAAPQVAADNATVTVTAGSTATNTGTWTQSGLAGADIITASVGTISQSGTGGSGTWSWSYPTSMTSQSQTVTITASDGQGDMATTTFQLIVNPDPTTTALVSSINPSYNGESVTLTATVTPTGPETIAPTGSVTFMDGSTVLGMGTLGGDVATITTTGLSTGSHSITASYGGDANFGSSMSAPLSQTVKAYGSTATVTSSVNPSVYGERVTFTATIKALSGGLTPTGSVTFLDGSTTLGTGTLSGGKITFSTTALIAGGHSITVSYGGDSNFTGSTSGVLTETVNLAMTTTRLSTSTSPSVFGQKVVFTAIVTANSPGAGTPTGMVTFYNGSTMLAVATLAGGRATFSTSAFAPGTYSISASYSGDANDTGSVSSAVTQVVNPADTNARLASSNNPSVSGQNVTFTATISAKSPGAGTPTGMVTFFNGTTALGTVMLTNGKATLATTSLTAGSYSITVSYSGDSNFTSSTSAVLTQNVNRAATTSTLTSSANPSVLGQSVTFTATVSAKSPGSGTPTGMVTFLDGSTPLATMSLSGGTAAYTTSTLALGTHSITIQYSGDSNFTASTSAVLKQTVNSPPAADKSSVQRTVVGASLILAANGQTVSPATLEQGPNGGNTATTGSTLNPGVSLGLAPHALFATQADVATSPATVATLDRLFTALGAGDVTLKNPDDDSLS